MLLQFYHPQPQLQMTSGCSQKSNLDSADEDLQPWKTFKRTVFLKAVPEEKGTRAKPMEELAGLER